MNYAGIDLGTTNSAICSYDGVTVRLHKSPDTNDVTPSALFFDRRGNKHVGARAYNNAAHTPENAARLFKRLMGTSTPITLAGVGRTMTPEECSAEVLRTLFGYLPEDLRAPGGLAGTVVTVPAVFNQMQKDATVAAADAAGIGSVALMQEPVAAVMSVMKQRSTDGLFVVYDLGGGTLDIAIAEGIAGRVSLLAHGGIEMCGGRDFDRDVFRGVAVPWLREQFELPETFDTDVRFKKLVSMTLWACEKAKIELSARDDAIITLQESELGVRDLAGRDVFLDVPLSRAVLSELIADRVDQSIQSARETLRKAGLSSRDVDRLVFVGGPTFYGPLRERVASELGIAPSSDVNAMTAVAEGAAIFAESIDWTSQSRGRKSTRGSLKATSSSLALSLEFIARTPDTRGRVVARISGATPAGLELQIDSLDTGWSSGRCPLLDGATLDVPLAKPGDNQFKVFVIGPDGGPVALAQDRVTITRTAAAIDAIPASHSIGVEVRNKVGGRAVLDYLVREGDQLPKKGRKLFRPEESLKAGSSGALVFKLWEGEIEDNPSENRPIGVFQVTGKDFDSGVIPAGADLFCDFEVLDSGSIRLSITVPSVTGTFDSGHNYYSRQSVQVDYTKASLRIADDARKAAERLEAISTKVDDPRLDEARHELNTASNLRPDETDPEAAKEALDRVLAVRRLLSETRQAHLKTIRQLDLDRAVSFFDERVRQYARTSETSTFENLTKTAQRAVGSPSGDFETYLDDLRGMNFTILWRQDWFVLDRFKWLAGSPYMFVDEHRHAELVAAGQEALAAGDTDRVRQVTAALEACRFDTTSDDDMAVPTNIIRS